MLTGIDNVEGSVSPISIVLQQYFVTAVNLPCTLKRPISLVRLKCNIIRISPFLKFPIP